MSIHFNRGKCEHIRSQAKQRFDKVRSTWIALGRWGAPYRVKWLLSQTEGERNNNHIVDPTHILAKRSYVAGFLEGNTSVTRPWYRIGGSDPDSNANPENKVWLEAFTKSTLRTLSNSNFYNEAAVFYDDLGTFNTGCHLFEELADGELFFHTLVPGSYYVINNGYGEAVVLVREFSLTVKALVKTYGRKIDGEWDWSNFSSFVKKAYNNGSYAETVDVVTLIEENEFFDTKQGVGGSNRQWVTKTYELGGENTGRGQATGSFDMGSFSAKDKEKHLRISFSKRKPFIVGRSHSSSNFEYGERGPMLDSLGLVKSLNKKALGKDQALEQMLKPTLQGPANLKKSYITNKSNRFIPLDGMSQQQGGLKKIYEMDSSIVAITQDVADMRQQVDRLFYADFLLFLSRNPKTRTATEADAVVQEQQMVIGPNLQSLNHTYNVPIVEFVMDFVLDTDPLLADPPKGLQGKFLKPEFISVFAQAQRAADLPQIERYLGFIGNVAQLNPAILDKVNVDKIADIYEDRLYLPSGINRTQDETEFGRQQAQAQQQRAAQLEELTQTASAAKDIGINVNNGGENNG